MVNHSNGLTAVLGECRTPGSLLVSVNRAIEILKSSKVEADAARSGALELLQSAVDSDIGVLPCDTLHRYDGLSDRERHVAQLLEDGFTNHQIAQELFISTNTVRFHVGRIFRKMGINSRKTLMMNARSDPSIRLRKLWHSSGKGDLTTSGNKRT